MAFTFQMFRRGRNEYKTEQVWICIEWKRVAYIVHLKTNPEYALRYLVYKFAAVTVTSEPVTS